MDARHRQGDGSADPGAGSVASQTASNKYHSWQTDTIGPTDADDPMTVFNLTDQVRETIQQTLYSLLMQRRSVFF